MTIGQRLKEEREFLKLNQEAFGEIGGAGRTTVIAWEKGESFPTASFLERAAKHGLDAEYVITGNRSAIVAGMRGHSFKTPLALVTHKRTKQDESENPEGESPENNSILSPALGERLKAERERLELSQQDAASIVGVRREMWGKYERSQADPGASSIERFCAHGADPCFLMTGQKNVTMIRLGMIWMALQEVQSWQMREQRFIEPDKIADLVMTIVDLAEEETSRIKPVSAQVLRLVA